MATTEITMPDETHIKCPCKHCGAHIEFPSHGVGTIIRCPHCGKKTELFWSAHLAGSSNATKPRRPNRRTIWIAAAMAILLVAGFVALLMAKKNPSSASEEKTNSEIVSPAPKIDPVEEKPAIDWHGLEPGRVAVEKAGNSRLVYAVGVIRNTSDRERFGVKVELDLLGASDEKVGSATDYIQSIQPGKEWKFKALVTDPRARRAEITAIKEN